MLTLDEDTITQAVIARNGQGADARLREVMTSLVQHLHAFARDTRLSEPEWRAALAFLAGIDRERGLPALSDTLGLSALVLAQSHRRPAGCTEASGVAPPPPAVVGAWCELQGRVLGLDGEAVAAAEVRLGPDTAVFSAADGLFKARAQAVPACEAADASVAALLQRLGRDARRPEHLPVAIRAPGYQPLCTQLFRRGDPALDHDAAFGVRRSLLADWHLEDGVAGQQWHISFDFVLNRRAA